MTTIAAKDGIIACDSKITGGFANPATKIRKGKGCLVGYAGDWIAGEAMAEYYISEGGLEPPVDDNDDIELLVIKKSGIYLVDRKFRKVKILGKHYSIGSGSMAAMVAMNMGATAVEAIKEAAKVDDYTGGRVISLSLE
jgi:hypothetical protein